MLMVGDVVLDFTGPAFVVVAVVCVVGCLLWLSSLVSVPKRGMRSARQVLAALQHGSVVAALALDSMSGVFSPFGR